MGEPPIPTALGGRGIGEPPIPKPDGGSGIGEPPIETATFRRSETAVKTTKNASSSASTKFFIRLSF